MLNAIQMSHCWVVFVMLIAASLNNLKAGSCFQAIESLDTLLKSKFADEERDVKPDVKKLNNDVSSEQKSTSAL